MPSGLALYINGEKQPIIISEPGKTILGREKAKSGEKVIDLSIFYAHLLGVSRAHAAIHIEEDVYKLEDLNSTNGTFINELQLIPNQPHQLKRADLIRLGQLLMIIQF